MMRFVTVLYSLTLFVAAALLFSVQPMIARTVLPPLGGSPAVWTTCMLFFQAALLAGYGYAHTLTSWLGLRSQVVVHAAVVLAAFSFLPIAATADGLRFTSTSDPTVELLGWLVRSAALPFFAVAATAPLLQSWFVAAGYPSSRDPYFLYAASNAGSLVALLGYPLWVERTLRLGEQSRAWSSGLMLLAGLMTVCASMALVRGRGMPRSTSREGCGPITMGRWLGWVVLALIPSSLMLGVTTYLTTDLASVPLLWVVPLALYLVTFILAFSHTGGRFAGLAGRALPLLVMALVPVMGVGLVQPYWIPLHLAVFFAAALVCHGELARRRPEAARLTSYYLALAVGGALGGAFNAVVAPVIFDSVAEYPIALVAACLVVAVCHDSSGEKIEIKDVMIPSIVGLIASALCADVGGLSETVIGAFATMAAAGLTVLVALTYRRRPVRFALTVGALLFASGLAVGVSGRVLYQERSFFGVLKVTRSPDGRFHRLFHGSTLHGQQSTDPALRREPLTYFERSGPIGQVFEAFRSLPGRDSARVAVTGVGAGALASYALPGERWSFYEIDPEVVRIARDRRFFTYLSDCRAKSLDVVVGDARLSMTRTPEHGFDLVILDAFSSHAIPVHLLTREAMALYRGKLADGGLIAVNITNRYLDMAPVLALLARDAGFVCRVRVDAELTKEQKEAGKQGSIWGVIAANEHDLGRLATDPNWSTPTPLPGDTVWTDDFSNILDHFQLNRFSDRQTKP